MDNTTYFSEKLIKRFWTHVERGFITDCWLWNGYVDRNGYGMFNVAGRVQYCNRYSLEIELERRLSRWEYSLHDCPGGDNPACVNPYHLFLGTQKDNIRDMIKKGRGLIGPQNGMSKLNNEKVLKILSDYKVSGGVRGTITKLAIENNVSNERIISILNGSAWKHVKRTA